MSDGELALTDRERARQEVVGRILVAAFEQLAEVGPAALSLRAVARDVGLVSSAVYRYFPSRDDLLTALIAGAYVDAGGAVEDAERAVRRGDHRRRWLAAWRGLRTWALEHPHEWALVFGSPVPGYQAPLDLLDPLDDVGPAGRVPLVLAGVVADSRAAAVGGAAGPGPARPLPARLRNDLGRLRTDPAATLDDAAWAQVVMAYSALVGAVSFELFGHLQGVVTDTAAWFDATALELAVRLGVAPS